MSVFRYNNKEQDSLVIVKKERFTVKERKERVKRVYNYLCDLANSNSKLPRLDDLHKVFNDRSKSNLCAILKQLDKENKIIYKSGKVIAVNVPNARGVKEKSYKFDNVSLNQTVPGKLEIKGTPIQLMQIDTTKFDKVVKDIIADTIKNADVLKRDDIVKEIDTIMSITDKLKKKLF